MFRLTSIAVAIFLLTASTNLYSDESKRVSMYRKYLDFSSHVKGGRVEANWMADGSSFWYADDKEEVLWKVDPSTASRTPLFDNERLKASLEKALTDRQPGRGLPFDKFDFVDGSQSSVRLEIGERSFILDLTTYDLQPAKSAIDEAASRLRMPKEVLLKFRSAAEKRGIDANSFNTALERLASGGGTSGISVEDLKGKSPQQILNAFAKSLRDNATVGRSPDGRWNILVRQHNIWVRSSDGEEVQLTDDGSEDVFYDLRRIEALWWSSDNARFAALRFDLRNAPKKRFVGVQQGPQEMLTDVLILDASGGEPIRIDLGDPAYWIIQIVRWHGDELLLLKMNRESNELDFIAADTKTGKIRPILREAARTFVIGWEWMSDRNPLAWVDRRRFIWESERSGWNHLYLYDVQGTLIQRLTSGHYPVERVITIDDVDGWVYFTAHGDQRHPYRSQLYRVSLDGSTREQLANNIGQHNLVGFAPIWRQIQFAPSKKYFIANRSSPSEPSVVELKRSNGDVVMELSSVDRDDLKRLQWREPEEFSFKAADGVTDLHGLMFKPYDFDPKKKYPVIDAVYGGDHISLMEFFASFDQHGAMGVPARALAQLGYLVVVMDARGTPGRSKDFHNVSHKNRHRHVIPDHVAGIRHLGKAHSFVDLDRVGILGVSAGGNMTLLGMLTAPDVFKVGIATEFSLGRGRSGANQYLDLAHNLQGRLLMVHGEPHKEDTARMARAFIDVNKFFDVLPIPGAGHSFTGADSDYWHEAIRRYFDEHLK